MKSFFMCICIHACSNIRHSEVFFAVNLHLYTSNYQRPLEHYHHPLTVLEYLVVMSIMLCEYSDHVVST